MIFEYWWIVIPGVLLGMYAQMKLGSTYRKYVKVGVTTGLTGAQASREILDRAGLYDVGVHEVRGHLTDHYDPRKRALFLSSENFRGSSLAAVGVAAHEAGHALQHQAAYAPLHLRMMMVPATQIASMAYLPLILLGFFLGAIWLNLAIALFVVIVLFQVITLPVEYDASRRAKQKLQELGIVRGPEIGGVSKVLNAAALTYVAAMVTSVLQLAQLLALAQGRE